MKLAFNHPDDSPASALSRYSDLSWMAVYLHRDLSSRSDGEAPELGTPPCRGDCRSEPQGHRGVVLWGGGWTQAVWPVEGGVERLHPQPIPGMCVGPGLQPTGVCVSVWVYPCVHSQLSTMVAKEAEWTDQATDSTFWLNAKNIDLIVSHRKWL